MKYNVASWNNFFVRTEPDGNSLLLVKPYGHQVVLNSTALHILKYVKEYDETDKVLNLLKNDFKEVDIRILENDMLELLRLLNVYQTIEWDTEDPRYISQYECSENLFQFRIAGDDDYKFLSDYLVQDGLNGLYSCANMDYKNYYSPFSIRYRVFNNQEYYAYACRNSQIIACISVIPPVSTSLVLNITAFFISRKLPTDEIGKCFNGMIHRLLVRLPDRIKKIRFNGTKETKKEILNLLISNGFTKECTLSNEVIQGDLTMYTYQL